MTEKFIKRSGTSLVVADDFSRVLNRGETVSASNARGNLGVVATDSLGTDVSSTLLEGTPWVVFGTRVAFWLRGGTAGAFYLLTITAPTSDGELIVDQVTLEVL